MRAGSSRRVRAGSKTKRNQSQLTVMAHSLPKQMRLSSEPCDAALLGACGTGEGRVPMAAGAARIHRGEKKWLKTEPATQGPIRRKPPRPKGALSKAVYSLRVKTNLSNRSSQSAHSFSPNRKKSAHSPPTEDASCWCLRGLLVSLPFLIRRHFCLRLNLR